MGPGAVGVGGETTRAGEQVCPGLKFLAAHATRARIAWGEVARPVGANPTTTDSWFRVYKRQGPEGLMWQVSHRAHGSCAIEAVGQS